MTDRSIVVHGHRGSRGTHPENILPSFQEAFAAGASFVELDVHLSKDGHVVVFHDFEISGKLCRDSSGELVRGKIPISELTLEQIQSYECGSAKLAAFPEQVLCPGARIPTLDELIRWKLSHAPQMSLNIEIKREKDAVPHRPSAEKLAQAVVGLIHQYDLARSTLVQSFDFSVVRAVRKLDSNLRLSCLFEEEADFAAETAENGAQVAAPFHQLVSEEKMEDCLEAGIEVLPWTVNEPEDWERLIDLGVRSIITDYPRKLAKFVAEMDVYGSSVTESIPTT
jgi:glycerophosphoryl diester phosphodiesterase